MRSEQAQALIRETCGHLSEAKRIVRCGRVPTVPVAHGWPVTTVAPTPMVPYDLRHTATTLQPKLGYSDSELAEWAGTSERMINEGHRHRTDRGASGIPADWSRSVPLLGAVLGGFLAGTRSGRHRTVRCNPSLRLR